MENLSATADELLQNGESLFTHVWFLMPNWKWLALGALLFLGYLLLNFSRWLGNKIRSRLERRFSTRELTGLFLQRPLHRPIAGLLAGIFIKIGMQELHMPPVLEKVGVFPLQIWLGFNAILLCYLGVDALGQLLENMAQRTESTLDDALAPMATKVMKIFIVILGILIVMQNFGVNVMSVLAGLGLGGLALALAAQDTAANLFGSIMIILDRPFQVGDYIKVGDTEGNVVEVGLRSTRIRTLGTSIVTIPNATVAKEKIDNVGARRSRRCRHIIGFTYGTKAEAIRQFIEQTRYLLSQNPKVLKEDQYVNFYQMGDFNLQVLVLFHMTAADLAEEYKIQEEILFEMMAIAEKLRIEFAFPTQTLHVASLPERPFTGLSPLSQFETTESLKS